MAKTITLKWEATCRDCGALLPVGTRARWYGRGRIYGSDCHQRPESECPAGLALVKDPGDDIDRQYEEGWGR